MARFCPNCGIQLEDDAVFCTSCGSKVDLMDEPQQEPNYNFGDFGYTTEPAPAPTPAHALKKMISKKHLILGGSILAGIIVIVIAFLLIFPTPKMVVRRCMNGVLNGNAKQIVNCMPSFMYEDNDAKKDAIEDLEDMLEDGLRDEYDKVTFKVKDVNNLSKDERASLEAMLSMYEKTFDDFDADDIDVKKAKKVEVKITIKDGSDTERETTEIIVVKYKGQWKIISGGFGFGF